MLFLNTGGTADESVDVKEAGQALGAAFSPGYRNQFDSSVLRRSPDASFRVDRRDNDRVPVARARRPPALLG
eukprot:gene4115-4446_t